MKSLKKKIINIFIKIESYHKKFNWEFFFFFLRFIEFLKKKINSNFKFITPNFILTLSLHYKRLYFILLVSYNKYLHNNLSSYLKLCLFYQRYLFCIASYSSLIKLSFNFILIYVLRVYLSVLLYKFLFLPTKKNKITVLSSPHVNKTAREQFEIKKYCQVFKLTVFNKFLLVFLYQLYCLPLKIQLFFSFNYK